jgi:hypothetical protein
MSKKGYYELYYRSMFDPNSMALKLRALADTAKMATMDHLNSWILQFIEIEAYEEAGILAKEIERRRPKYKFYLTAPDGTMTELKGLDYIELPW